MILCNLNEILINNLINNFNNTANASGTYAVGQQQSSGQRPMEAATLRPVVRQSQ